jgi:uncharacterized cysteine cluster protein YcgN (CxxCxxCC family)
VSNQEAFWETKTLDQLTEQEWESLCDGCGRCCLQKIICEDEHLVRYTRVACRLLDVDSCQCTNYWRRQSIVPECISLTADNIDEFDWLPDSCAYVRVKEQRGLAWWHPLVSGSKETVHEAGISMRGKALSETYIHADDIPTLTIRFDND